MSKCLKFCSGIEIFKADFLLKNERLYRHELGVQPPQLSGNPDYFKHRCDKRQKIIINVNKRVYSEKDSKRL